MKVLIIKENGRHEANRHMIECLSIQRSFRKFGHEADVWGLGFDNYNDKIDFESYDLIINLENYDVTNWLPDLSNVKTTKYLWVIDAHCRGMEPYMKIFKEGNYDLILQATKHYLNDNSVWLPNACDQTFFYPREVEKSIDLGFCGSMLNRKGILNFLSNKYGLETHIWKIGEEMINLVSSFKIGFNVNLSNDINFRSFETMSCGAALLTNYNPQYDELGFVDEENCLMYRNMTDICTKLDKYLNNPEEIARIAKNGHELSKLHTYDDRIKRIIKIFNGESDGSFSL